MASPPQASCTSDPNFAVICAFLERFALSCGITYPAFTDLQEMLENVEQVSQELVDLHIKLLRKARKTVFMEKWEKALVKFCNTYSSQDGWEIEHCGYKKCKLEVKLRALKMLLEGQFDLNAKFKASINTLESEELRAKPLGKDKNGRIYWCQFDIASNIRVYREDLDDESWTLVAQDRETLVKLLQELSGDDFVLDLNILNTECSNIESDKQIIDTGQDNNLKLSDNGENSGNFESSSQEIEHVQLVTNGGAVENGVEQCSNASPSISLKPTEGSPVQAVGECSDTNVSESKIESVSDNKINGPDNCDIVNDSCADSTMDGAIEEPVMYIIGEGSGEDCLTGNPERTEECEEEDQISGNEASCGQMKVSNAAETNSISSTDKHKPAPKLWSIETICGVNSSNKMSECVNISDKAEDSDVKSKQKNYSSFSIDSVLEKKKYNSPEMPSISNLIDYSHDTVSENVIVKNLADCTSDSVKTTANDIVNNHDMSQLSASTVSFTDKNAGECLTKSELPIAASLGENKVGVENSENPEQEKLMDDGCKGDKHESLKPKLDVSLLNVTGELSEENKKDVEESNKCGSEDKNSTTLDDGSFSASSDVEASQQNNKISPGNSVKEEKTSQSLAEESLIQTTPHGGDTKDVESLKTDKETDIEYNLKNKENKRKEEDETQKNDTAILIKNSSQKTHSLPESDTNENEKNATVEDNSLSKTDLKKENRDEHEEPGRTHVDDLSESVKEEVKGEEFDVSAKNADQDGKEESSSSCTGVEIEKNSSANNSECTEMKSENVVDVKTESEQIKEEFDKEVKETVNQGAESVECQDSEGLKKDVAGEITAGAASKKRQKKVLPQRILSRNRKTVEVNVSESDNGKAPNPQCDTANTDQEKKLVEENEDKEEKEETSKGKNSQEDTVEKPRNIENVRRKSTRARKGCSFSKRRRKRKVQAVATNKENRNEEKMKEKEKDKNEKVTDGIGVSGGDDGEEVDKKEIISDGTSDKKKERPKRGGKGRQVPCREIKLLGITETDVELPSVRQSRRIAQIKMKEEAARRQSEALQLESLKKKTGKSSRKKKSKKNADNDSYDEKDGNYGEDSDEGKSTGNKERSSKKKKKKDKLVFDELNPWLSSSGSSTAADDEEDDIEDEQHEDEELVFKSDHEFSMESDIEDPDYKPVKRARTAKVDESEKDAAGKYDDTSCENCRKNDHPEWILLCDKCDKGWHASCLRPTLMIIPEGDWYCPPCEHSALITKLKESLIQYDRCQKQRENEELRKKRLAFVGISLDNVLPPKASSKNENDAKGEENEGEGDSGSAASDTESGSSKDDSESEDEPVYQLRERRSNLTSYRYNEYDELIKSALQDEIEAVKGAGNAGRGKDISNIVNAEKQRKNEQENGDKDWFSGKTSAKIDSETGEVENSDTISKERENTENNESNDDERDTESDDEVNETDVPPVLSKKKKSKRAKIMSLDFTSEEEDNNSDSDFKGASSEEESDYSLQSESEYSDYERKKKGSDGPLRRSTRARVSRYDRDFINDESDDSPKRKKSRREWDSSESSDSDQSWGRRKRSRRNSSYQKNVSKKYNKNKKKEKRRQRSLDSASDGGKSPKKSRNRKIKYGELESLDEGEVLNKRTRGKKINYQEMTGSDSEDDGRNRKVRSSRIIESDDEFIAENEKNEDVPEGDSEEMDTSGEEGEEEEAEEEDEEEGKHTKSLVENIDSGGRKTGLKQILEKMKSWAIPRVEHLSEYDVNKDEELIKCPDEFFDLDEGEEAVLRNILESGELSIGQIKIAIERAREQKKAAKCGTQNERESSKLIDSVLGHSEYSAGGGKLQKIGKLGGIENPISLKEKFVDNETSERGLMQKTLDKDQIKPDRPGAANSSSKNPIKVNPRMHADGSFVGYSRAEGPAGIMTMMNARSELTGDNNRRYSLVNESLNSGHSTSKVSPFPDVAGLPGMSTYPSVISSPSVSNYDINEEGNSKSSGKSGIKIKRKADEISPQSEHGSLDSGEIHGEDEFSQGKGVSATPVSKKGRGRGKKFQAEIGDKLQSPKSSQVSPHFSPSLAAVGGSMISRMLNSTPSGPNYPTGEQRPFGIPPRNRAPFVPPHPSHFSNSPRSLAALPSRPPAVGSTIFHTSHPLDPSPSGGGPINILISSSGLAKPPPAPPVFSKAPGLMPPRVTSDSPAKPVFSSHNFPPRPEFSYSNYYAAIPPAHSSASSTDSPGFHSSGIQESFNDDIQNVGGPSTKQFEDDAGGEFGGLASYFASQRETDLDT